MNSLLSPKGIRVVRVSPGWVETEAAVGLVNELAANKGTDRDPGPKETTSIGRAGRPIGMPPSEPIKTCPADSAAVNSMLSSSALPSGELS